MTARHPCFQRFQSPDPAALAADAQRDTERLEQARRARDGQAQLELLTSIGGATIILGHEDAAVPIIQEALALAEKREDRNYEILNLLNLATAQQYLDQRDLAQTLFQQALDKGHAYGVRDYEDFVWRHRGRCYVEQGKIDEAREFRARAGAAGGEGRTALY